MVKGVGLEGFPGGASGKEETSWQCTESNKTEAT